MKQAEKFKSGKKTELEYLQNSEKILKEKLDLLSVKQFLEKNVTQQISCLFPALKFVPAFQVLNVYDSLKEDNVNGLSDLQSWNNNNLQLLNASKVQKKNFFTFFFLHFFFNIFFFTFFFFS